MAMVVQRRPSPQPVDWALLPPSRRTLPPVRVLLARTSHQRIKEHLIFSVFIVLQNDASSVEVCNAHLNAHNVKEETLNSEILSTQTL